MHVTLWHALHGYLIDADPEPAAVPNDLIRSHHRSLHTQPLFGHEIGEKIGVLIPSPISTLILKMDLERILVMTAMAIRGRSSVITT